MTHDLKTLPVTGYLLPDDSRIELDAQGAWLIRRGLWVMTRDARWVVEAVFLSAVGGGRWLVRFETAEQALATWAYSSPTAGKPPNIADCTDCLAEHFQSIEERLRTLSDQLQAMSGHSP